MSIWESILLGLLQGLTEFLPVSSSGHLELGRALLGIDIPDSMTFTLFLHLATVLSILAAFGKDILSLCKEALRGSQGLQYLGLLALSALPVAVVGLFLKDWVESFFDGRTGFVGAMLCVTSLLLFFSGRKKEGPKSPTWMSALIIGLAQAVAVLPGISRSGATISTALMLGIKREEASRFAFLMVIAPILGASFLDLKDAQMVGQQWMSAPYLAGFVAAFVSGWLACRWMIRIVNRGNLLYFSVYCLLAGITAMVLA